MFFKFYNFIKKFFFLFATLCVVQVHAQFFNKDVVAKIKVEKNSEFLSFTATAENITPSDYNLRYDFMMFTINAHDSVEKQNKEDRFFLEAHKKILLPTITINYNIEGRIILVLLLYDDENKPIGQDRIVLDEGGKTVINNNELEPIVVSADQAAPQDGFVMTGFLTENTITKAGRDFYRYLYSDYYNKDITSSKNIVIDEVPGRLRSTRISVKVGDVLVWQFFSQPRKEFLKQMAEIAINRITAQLQQLEKQKDNFIHY